MDLGLKGRTVIVTGASGGLGRTIARGFAAEGADVVVTYHAAREMAEQVAKEVEQLGGRALVERFALDDPASAGTLKKAVLDWTGRIDVLINNAVSWGGMTPEGTTFEQVADDDWLGQLRNNVEGAIRLTREVAPAMRERGWGRVVHISSSLSTEGSAGSEYYGTAKAALHGFSRSLAFSLGSSGDILSNVVIPGLTATDTNGEITEQWGHVYAERAPIGRLLTASEVAGPIVYLASAANTGITGQAITVNGGA